MPDKNNSEQEANKPGENSESQNDASALSKTDTTRTEQAPAQAPGFSSAPSFKEPAVLDAIVNPKTPQKEGPTPFSFTDPKAMQEEMVQPTKGDVAANETKKPYASLEALDAAIAKEQKDGQALTIDDYTDSATMFVDAWESALIMICRAISKDSSDSAYGFPAPTREKLIRHGIKVSRKRGWVIPIEVLAGGTLMAATTNIVMKAVDKKKEDSKRKKENPDKAEIVKGGPEKGNEKKRGPGRPAK